MDPVRTELSTPAPSSGAPASEPPAFKPHRSLYRNPIWRTFNVTIQSPGKNLGKPQCRAGVFHGRGDSNQCARPGVVQDDGGYWWCKGHSPDADAARQAASDRRVKAYLADSRARVDLEIRRDRLAANASRYEEALQQIAAGHNDPRALAAATLADGPSTAQAQPSEAPLSAKNTNEISVPTAPDNLSTPAADAARGDVPKHRVSQGHDRNSFNRGVRACIAWLHAEAETMNDPHARGILNAAAWRLGQDKPPADRRGGFKASTEEAKA